MWGIHANKKSKRQLTDEQLTIGENLSFAAAEAYKLLRTNILFALPDEQRCRAVGVTSAYRGEGKSTTSVNLGYMLAEAGERVLLMEADMRLPALARRLGLSSVPGLSNVLAGLCGVDEALQVSNLHEDLFFLSAGDIPPNPSELLGSGTFGTLMRGLAESFDFIILDLPPVGEVTDALVASKLTDGMVMVVRQKYGERRALADTMRQLKYANAKVLGFVMTCSETQSKGKYKGYGKGYGYGYGYGGKWRGQDLKGHD